MGKSAPSPPPAPDPAAIAAAQESADAKTAQLQSVLNNGNSYGPFGSVVNKQAGPGGQWTQTTTLSPAEQAIFNAGTAAQAGALGLANTQLGRIGQTLGTGVTAPAMAGSVSAGSPQFAIAPAGPITAGFNPGLGVQGQVAQAPAELTLVSVAPIDVGAGSNLPGAAPLATSYNAGGPIQSALSAAPPLQTGVNPAALGDPAVQNAINAQYGQATSRLDPQWAQASEQQQAQLTAQGLNPNDAAWRNSMTLFNNAKNDAYNQALSSAIGAGDQEQNTLYGQALGAGQFANAAQGQQFGQQLAAG